MKRIVFHIDVNSAFLSWESASRVKRGMSDLRLVPSAIGGDRDKRGKGNGRVRVEGRIYHFNAGWKTV